MLTPHRILLAVSASLALTAVADNQIALTVLSNPQDINSKITAPNFEVSGVVDVKVMCPGNQKVSNVPFPTVRNGQGGTLTVPFCAGTGSSITFENGNNPLFLSAKDVSFAKMVGIPASNDPGTLCPDLGTLNAGNYIVTLSEESVKYDNPTYYLHCKITPTA